MSRKEKLLASAKKNLAKKQVSRAIKDYEKLVEEDPKDVRMRQKLAELYFRSNRVEEAIEEYEAVAKYFAENDFQVKAIAIYKQIQRLDPENFQSYIKLAELNEKQGLIGNAMAEYQNLVKFYESHGDTAQAISTLQKMRDLDPGNLNVRAKLVEICARNDRQNEAVEEFQGISEHLQQKKAYDKILKLYEMFLPILPEVPAMQKGLAGVLIEKGEVDKAIRLVQDLLKQSPSDVELLGLMATGYSRQGDFKGARVTCQQMMKLEPKNLGHRSRYIQASLDDHQWEAALVELEEWKDAFLQAEKLQQLKTYYETLRNEIPDDRRVLQTLDSIYALTGEGDKLLDIMAPGSVGDSGESFGTAPSTGVEENDFLDSFEDEVSADLELGDGAEKPDEAFELDGAEFLDLEDDEELTFESVVEAGGDSVESPEEEGFFDLELELEPEEDLAEAPGSMSLEVEQNELNLGADEGAGEQGIPTEAAFGEALDVTEADAESDMPDVIELDLTSDYGVDDAPAVVPESSGVLEEADLLLGQNRFDEAEQVCRTFLDHVPDAVEVQAKLQQVQQSRPSVPAAEAPDALVPPVKAAAPSETGLMDFSDLVEEVVQEGQGEARPAEQHPEAEGSGQVRLQEQLDNTDIESHYNLGIAYREMGLVDDAIAEFRKIKQDPARFVDCHTLLGQCMKDKGDREGAEKEFRAALEYGELSDGQRYNLHYELGLLYEDMERPMDALDSFQYVADFDPFFRDVKEKIARLRQQLGLEPGTTSNSKDRVSYL